MSSYDPHRLHRVLGPDLVSALTDAQRAEVDADCAQDEAAVTRAARGLSRADVSAPAAVLLHRLRRQREARAQVLVQREARAAAEQPWDEVCDDPASPAEAVRWLALQRTAWQLPADSPLRRAITLHCLTAARGTGRALLLLLEAIARREHPATYAAAARAQLPAALMPSLRSLR